MSKINVDSFILEDTPVKDIVPKLEILRKGFASNKTRDFNFRREQLIKLKNGIEKYTKEIHRTNYLDLGFSEFYSFYNVLNIVLSDINYIIKNFEKWAAERSVDTPLLLAPARSYLFPEPFGVCLIFSAWNSQFQTLLQPMAAAIAAGNVILAKPSEMAPYSAKLMEYIFAEMDPEIVQIVQGGADQCIELTKNKSDIIVFTGSPMKGKLVAKCAAEFLTPCILELGGQNPVIVDETADIKCAAYNLINGRFTISGQACIAPEYVMIHRSVYDPLVKALEETFNQMLSKDPKTSNDYGRIINEWHSDRLTNLIKNHGGEVVVGGGESDIKQKYVPPTIVKFKSLKEMGNSVLAKEEIFGPILYLAPYDNFDDTINYINSKDKPLSLYYFGFDKKHKSDIKTKTSSGALLFNDTLVHFINHYLPFGGVGTSGFSAYHGKFGFDNLSHLKPIMDRDHHVVPIRYPPFTSTKQSLMKKMLLLGDFTQSGAVKSIGALLFLALAVYLRHNIYAGLVGFYNGPKF